MTQPGSPPAALEQVLADLDGEASVLRYHGQVEQAKSLERAIARVREACPDYLTWVTVDEAVARSGRSRQWIRGLAAALEPLGHVKRDGRAVRLRAIVVPLAPLRAIERRRGRRASQGS